MILKGFHNLTCKSRYPNSVSVFSKITSRNTKMKIIIAMNFPSQICIAIHSLFILSYIFIYKINNEEEKRLVLWNI
jgi:hypothetical protein